MIYRLICWAS